MPLIHFQQDFPTLPSKKTFLELLLLKFPLTYQRVLQGKDYDEVAAWIYSVTPKLQDKQYNTATRVYWILNGIEDFPMCKNCGDHFGIGANVAAAHGYRTFCSRKCAASYSQKKKEGTSKAKIAKASKKANSEIPTELLVSASSFFKQFKEAKFPYPEVTDGEIATEIKQLSSPRLYSDKLYSPIIRRYCLSIWKCESHYTMSPYAYWEHMKTDFEAFKKLYSNRMKYRGKVSLDILRDGMNIAKFAGKVTYFKPHLAKRLIKTYLSDAAEIFNPFNGFSGIMLGATLGCSKKYVGQDINQTFVDEANKIIDDLKIPNASVAQKDVFEDSGERDCLFCCPPYGLDERWNFDSDGSCVDKDLSCDDWIEAVLERYKCRKCLFVVNNSIKRYRKNIVESLSNTSHLNKNDEVVVLL